MNTDITMKLNILQEAIGQIDFDLIEESETAPEKAARVTAFAKPWMKWAVAAVLIIVIGVGTPVALRMMGAFRSDNLVAPGSESGGSEDGHGIITPVDSSEPESSSAPEVEPEPDASVSENRSHNASSERGSESGGASNGGQTVPEKPVDTDPPQNEDPPAPPDEPPAEYFEGEFVKDDMPAVTYRINGEEKTFTYQKSTYKKKTADMALDGNGGNYVVDHYVDGNGNTVSKSSDSKGLIQYEKDGCFIDSNLNGRISEEEAIETAKYVVMNTDLTINRSDNLIVSVRCSSNRYSVTFKTEEMSVEVCLDMSGALQYLAVKKNALQQLSSARVSAAIEKMEERLAELNNDSSERYVLNGIHFEEWGDTVYAVFDVLCYRAQSSDEYCVYQYYCVV